MSANIPVNMRLDDLLKATGYNCPEELQGKTFDEATSGGGGGGGTLYAWNAGSSESPHYVYFSFDIAPATQADFLQTKTTTVDYETGKLTSYDTSIGSSESYVRGSDTEFALQARESTFFVRSPEADLVI